MFQNLYNFLSLRSHKPQRSDNALAFFQLSHLLSAGVSLSDALDDLASGNASGRSQRLWRQIALSVSSGKLLSASIELTPIAKDRMIIALIRAGEATGRLHDACDSVYQYLEWQIGLRQRFYTLLIYPLFSFCVLVIVVGFLFVSVVPSMQGFLVSSGSALEWHTAVLIRLSSWLVAYYLPMVVVVAALLGLVLTFLSVSTRVRFACDAWLLRFPVLGRLIVDLALSRYSHCCAQLYGSGVALEASMELAEGTVMSQSLKANLSNAREAVTRGASLAQAIGDIPNMPSLFARFVEVGEASGQLADVLVRIGEHQRSVAEVSIKRMEQLIGPMVLMSVGAMLLWIAVSVLGPVYNLAIAAVVGAP